MARSPSSEFPDQNSMDAVRELLFGGKATEIDERIKSLERDLISTNQRIEDRLERKIEALEQAVKIANAELNRKIEKETSERQSQNLEMQELIDAYRKMTNQRFAESEQTRRKKEIKLRRKIEDDSSSLSREIAQVAADLKKRILNEIENVRDEHLDLEEMGQLLVGIGRKLDPKLAQKEKDNPRSGNSQRPNMVKLSR